MTPGVDELKEMYESCSLLRFKRTGFCKAFHLGKFLKLKQNFSRSDSSLHHKYMFVIITLFEVTSQHSEYNR